MMRRRTLAMTLGELLGAVAIIALVIALCLPAVRTAREPARRNSCMNNLKQIILALLDYESKHGALPPAYTVDSEGNRLHSWRTLILPFMGSARLYESIDLSKPWDDPANEQATKTIVECYHCPSSGDLSSLTCYLGVDGPSGVFSGSVARKLSEVSDTAAETIAVVEVTPDQAIHWMSPHDVTADQVLQYNDQQRMNHPNVMLAAFLDGHVKAINVSVDKDVLRALLTIAGGEPTTD
jgi:type II secretory pathway pseudopilin PulG